MLTQKQHDLLEFISARLDKGGVSPSYDEMKDALDLRSKSGIHRMILSLEERGFIRRIPDRARAIEVVSRDRAISEATIKELKAQIKRLKLENAELSRFISAGGLRRSA